MSFPIKFSPGEGRKDIKIGKFRHLAPHFPFFFYVLCCYYYTTNGIFTPCDLA